ncbi:MAG TPA: SUF system Fe-S cluster assembly regulator [Armatimonadota bacterium]|jgi:FeS assembly SUF system regulator
MIRISRLTDYGLVLLAQFAHGPEGHIRTGRDLAEQTHLPVPTVSKLLKTLTREGLLVSQRGVQGGYRLSRRPEEISVVDIIGALEGPIAVTLCSLEGTGECSQEDLCPVQSSWRKINSAVHNALEGIKLSDMVGVAGSGRPRSDLPGARDPRLHLLQITAAPGPAATGVS